MYIGDYSGRGAVEGGVYKVGFICDDCGLGRDNLFEAWPFFVVIFYILHHVLESSKMKYLKFLFLLSFQGHQRLEL